VQRESGGSQHGLTGQPTPPETEISAGKSPRFVRKAVNVNAPAAGVDDDLDHHFSDVAAAILDGDVVPVLGAGVNLCDRADDEPWEHGRSLPSGSELADMLAQRFAWDATDRDLVHVSQAAVLRRGADPLFKLLHSVFVGDYEPTSVHRFLAGLPALRERRGLEPSPQLILTTNYDALLERAFTQAGRPFDVLYYGSPGVIVGKVTRTHVRVEGWV